MPVAAPADRRFRRAHVKPARRRRAWVRRAFAVLRAAAAATFVAWVAWHVVEATAQARLLPVDSIQVRGTRHLSRGEVLTLLEGLRGEPLLWTDLEQWRRRLHGSPWVHEAALRRVLPSTVDVVIRERSPMAIARLGRELYLVDDEGLVIDRFGPNYAQFDLPIVDGLSTVPYEGQPLVDAGRARLAGRLIAAARARPELLARISQIDVTDARDAVVILEGETALVHLGDDQFVDRLQTYVDLAEALHQHVPVIEYVDLRFGDRVYVRPAAGAPRALPASTGRR